MSTMTREQIDAVFASVDQTPIAHVAETDMSRACLDAYADSVDAAPTSTDYQIAWCVQLATNAVDVSDLDGDAAVAGYATVTTNG